MNTPYFSLLRGVTFRCCEPAVHVDNFMQDDNSYSGRDVTYSCCARSAHRRPFIFKNRSRGGVCGGGGGGGGGEVFSAVLYLCTKTYVFIKLPSKIRASDSTICLQYIGHLIRSHCITCCIILLASLTFTRQRTVISIQCYNAMNINHFI